MERQNEMVEEIVYSAPGRCGIVGNPSDIYGGFVVSAAVPARNRCRLVPSSEPPKAEALWQAATARLPLDGWQYEWNSEVPRSSGLAGSTALLAATLAAIRSAHGNPPDLATIEGRSEFAEWVRDVELREAGVVCGYQDAYMAVHGGLLAMDFAGKHPIEPGPVAQVERLSAELPFLLVTTGVQRLSGSVHGPMRERWLEGDAEVRSAMERIADLGRQGRRALLEADWAELGGAMNENHRLVTALGGSGEPIDRLVATCLDLGARAAKLAGAGLGGTVIALSDDPAALQGRLERAGYRQFMVPDGGEGLCRESPHN